MAHIYSMINQKGGVGKTASAINIAATFARVFGPDQVLVIDLDPQANTTSVFLGVDVAIGPRHATDPVPTVREVLLEEVDADAAIQVATLNPIPAMKIPKATNLHILPSHPELGGIEIDISSNGMFRLADIVDELASYYAVIIIDCPGSLGAFTRAAMLASTSVLIPVSPGSHELVGIKLIRDAVAAIQKSDRLNPNLYISGVLPTRIARNTVSRESLTALKAAFPNEILPAVRNRVALQNAVASGLPLLDYDSSSDAARDYISVTKVLIKRHGLTAVVVETQEEE